MNFSQLVRQHTAALRALLVLTVIIGLAYPVLIWLIAQIPGLRANADGSLVQADGKVVGSSLIGQSFTDADGNPLPQYFLSRPSAGNYDPLATGASNLGPESIVDAPDKPSLLTLICERSNTIGELDGVDGSRPFCTGGGVGAVLSVIGPRDARGNVVNPTRVVSVNEPCDTTQTPFLDTYEGVRVECRQPGEDYSIGQIVPIRGSAPADPAVPADAVTASGSGLDPHISVAYADIQVNRVAAARGVQTDEIRRLVAENTDGRVLGFLGEPTVDVLALNTALEKLTSGG
ncbi:potassium-transporting ATPase subunit C [Mycolicibacterium celeriflavum]|uniref:Potassium-transporting ATPase KdpC subunit n=1 Tax=Mycolicibacterium celeriflavum TaxID=1249101 RepID=A0A1X0BMB1_MYCCF|nr:potassium-transporting ATPase subunit C [Mycolicibacterium celeriflavum]MCV7237962.1 potassium-transporting ATPase subunit C [Mycolicibacterium celeriflavum]ORA43700.1 K+-transporting ATPase subunit C [Mycolicibacterium celeriflavum]BBY46036.1 potassium-transporting ATPase KdpC subunit [Mycolicibacterium celeriflavum]